MGGMLAVNIKTNFHIPILAFKAIVIHMILAINAIMIHIMILAIKAIMVQVEEELKGKGCILVIVQLACPLIMGITTYQCMVMIRGDIYITRLR